MSRPDPHTHLTVAEYLEGELRTEIRHEYVAGVAYAMGGASSAHNLISGNLFASLHTYLRGGPCQVFTADMKLRIREAGDEYYYYPDVMVSCRPDDKARYHREQPLFVAEVLSESTTTIDRREKRLIYPRIESLQTYLILEQERIEAQIYRRDAGWISATLKAGDMLTVDALKFSMPLAQLYEGVPDL